MRTAVAGRRITLVVTEGSVDYRTNGNPRLDLERVQRLLNAHLDGTFHFQVSSDELPVQIPGRRELADGAIFPSLATRLGQTANCDALIAITHHPLQDSSFNRHDVGSRVGVITLLELGAYAPDWCTQEQYLAYLILCEATCLAAGNDFEHPEVFGCLYDLCAEKTDLYNCLANPRIHPDCITRLSAAGYNPTDIERMNRLLRDTGRPRRMKLAYDRLFRRQAGGLITTVFFAALPVSIPLAAAMAATGLVLTFLVPPNGRGGGS